MIKKFTLILSLAMLLVSPFTSANEDLLEVEDFSTGYQIKKIPARQTSPMVNKPSMARKPFSANVAGKPASFNKNKKQMVIKKIVTRPTPKSIPQQQAAKQKPITQPAQTAQPKRTPASLTGVQVKKVESKPVITAPKPLPNPVIAITKRKPVVVIDPGHGGKDHGTTGKLGTREKDVVLAYSLALKKELERSGKYKVVMTRGDDRFIELNQRVRIARKAGGDVMISIHADSNPNKTTRGFSVYTLSGSRAKAEAAKLLAKSDREEVVRGASLRGESRDVKEAIIDFAQGSTKDVSDDFAHTVAKNLGRRIQALKRHNREGSLAVLTGSDIPSVLVELGYLSNNYEERLLKREDHKRQIVTSIKAALDEYFGKFNMVF